MVLESRGTSEQFACRSPIPPLPLLSFSSLQTNRNPSRVERESLREKFPLPFLFFFFLIQFILYRNPVTKRERLVYSNNRIFSKQDSGVDRESFEYSSVNFTVTGLRSRMYNSSAGLKLELFRFFPAIFFFVLSLKKMTNHDPIHIFVSIFISTINVIVGRERRKWKSWIGLTNFVGKRRLEIFLQSATRAACN